MLSSQSSGKILSGKFIREREAATRDASSFSSDQLDYLGVSSDSYEENDKYQRDAVHVDPGVDQQFTERPNAVDARALGDQGRIY